MAIRQGEKRASSQSYAPRRWLFNLLLMACLGLITILTGPGSALAGPVIIAFGDSLTHGYGLNEADTFPVRLAAALKAQGLNAVEVINAGVSGDTSADGLARLDWSLPSDGLKPDLVIVEFGANDMLRGLAPQAAADNLDQIVARLQERGIAVLLAGMRAAPNLGADYQAAFDRIYPDLAARRHVPLYPFFLDGVAADPSRLQADGMHPNPKGVETIVERILPSIVAALKSGRS